MHRPGLLLFLMLVSVPVLLALPPAWWSEPQTQVLDPINPATTTDNYAPANLGQLKHVAKQAKAHLDSHLPDGSGLTIDTLVAGFGGNLTVEQREANYAPINLGQLKSVAKPFYDRLLEFQYDTKANLIDRGFPSSWTSNYPWNPATAVAENYAPANLGQLKAVFSFDLSAPVGQLPEWWQRYFFNGQIGISPNGDSDRDGLSNLIELTAGTSPTNLDSDGDGLPDGFEIFIGSDPAQSDTNDNGVPDGDELGDGGNPGLPGPAPSPPPAAPGVPPVPPDPAPTPPSTPAGVAYEILVETKSISLPKYGFDTFETTAPPKRYLIRMDQDYHTPTSATPLFPYQSVSLISTIDPFTGLPSQTSSSPGYSPDMQCTSPQATSLSPLRRSVTGTSTDQNGFRDNGFFSYLRDENTTDEMVDLAKSHLPDFTNTFEEGTPFAFRNVHENELQFDYQKVKFKFRWRPETTEEQKHPIKHILLFQPENDPATENIDESIENAEILDTPPIEWDGLSAESPPIEIDPDTVKQGVDGTYSLLPVDIVPDWNRDGVIDNRDRSKVTEEKPWRWWLNDDNDEGDLGGDDHPGSGSNGNDSAANGLRDLVDFFPLYFDFKQLVTVLPPESCEYRIVHEGVGLNFIYTDLTVDDVRKHHHEQAVADELKGAQINKIYANGLTKLSASFLNKIKNEEGKGVLLVEAGFAASDKPLVIEVWKDVRKLTEIKFHVRTSSIEKMYRHLNILTVGGQSGGLPTSLSEPENMPDAYCSDKNFVFVHGYNINPTQARGWFAEMFKRLWHSGSRAKFTGVTWHGYESQFYISPPLPYSGYYTPDYQANVLNAFASAQALKDGLLPLSGPVTIAGHSLANMLIGSAMEDWSFSAANYFMIDAAVAKECYNESEEQTYIMSQPWWEDYDDILRATEWHRLPWPGGDWRAKLTWKNRLEGVASAHNFYSTGEEVLQNPPHGNTAVPVSAAGVWAAQEKRKGYGLSGYILTSAYGGWNVNFHPDYVTPINDPKTQVELTALYGPTSEAAFQNKLMTMPFFNTGFDPVTSEVNPDAPSDIQNLFGASGSTYASPEQNRNRLLAEMIPARSTAAGSNPVAGVPGFDMNANKNGWPRDDQRWRHSDLREVGYFFTYKTFDEFVVRGELNQ